MDKKLKYEILIVITILALILIPSMINSSIDIPGEEESLPAADMGELQKPGTKIAVLTGSELYNAAEEAFPEGRYLQYDTFADVFNALSTGKADAALGFDTNIPIVAESYPDLTYIREVLTDYTYGFGTQKNKKGEALCKEMNAYFNKLVSSGDFETLANKWYESNGAQCMDEYAFTGKKGTLKIASLGTWSPMTFYAGDELTGLFIELMNGFCQSAGYTPVYTTMPYASEIAGLNSGEYDVIADNIVRIPDRLDSINITDPLFSNDVYVFVHSRRQSTGTIRGPKAFFMIMKNRFVKNILDDNRWKMLVSGLGVTLAIALLAGLFGTILGGAVCFLRMSRSQLANAFADLYIRLFRGIPIVVLLLVLNYLIFKGADFDPFWICVIGFSLDFAAYSSEIFRSGIEAVPDGQRKAARALGFSTFDAFKKVVFPQAMTHFIPVYSGQLISMVKLTSVAGYISVMDLTRASDIIRSRTYDAFFPLLFTTLIYMLLCILLNAVLRALEMRIRPVSRKLNTLKEHIDKVRTEEWSAELPPAGERGEILRISHLKKSYGETEPLTDVNCAIACGDVISIIGPSGVGKSTLLNIIDHLETADGGEILFKGENTLKEGYDVNSLRKKVGMVFQSFNLFSHLTIVENLMLAQTGILGRSEDEALRRALLELDKVGLKDKALSYPEQLSGGQQQRAAIARAVAMDPEMILLDEPTSALDPTTIGEVLSVIKGLADNGMTMLIVTHEMKFAGDVSTRIFYMDQGIIYEEGRPEEILTSPKKDRTRQFISKLKVLDFTITGLDLSFGDAEEKIEGFGRKHRLGRRVINKMIAITEELGPAILQKHFREETDIRITFELDSDDNRVDFKAVFTGEDYDPLKEGDPVAAAIAKNAVSDLKYEYTGGQGLITGYISK